MNRAGCSLSVYLWYIALFIMVGKGVAGSRGRIHSAYNGEGGEIVIWPVISYYTFVQETFSIQGMEHCTLGDAFAG